MYTRKNKRFAVVLAALLAISMIFSGLTAFADGTPSSSSEETTSSSESTSVEAATQSAEESSQESSAEFSQESSVESSQKSSQEESSGESSEGALEESSIPETPEVADGDTVVLGASYTVTVTQPDMGEVKVTYEKDGSEVAVNSGDKVSEGTELTIALEMPDVSDLIEEMGVNPYQFMKVIVNGANTATNGENPFKMTYTVAAEDVAVSVDSGIGIMPFGTNKVVGPTGNCSHNNPNPGHNVGNGTPRADWDDTLVYGYRGDNTFYCSNAGTTISWTGGYKVYVGNVPSGQTLTLPTWITAVEIDSSSTFAGTVSIPSAASVIVAGGSTINGTLAYTGGSITASGTVNLGPNANVPVGAVAGASKIVAWSSGSQKPVISGNLNIGSGMILAASGEVTVSGGITISGGTIRPATSGEVTGASGSCIINGSGAANMSAGTVETSVTVKGSSLSATGGTLKGIIDVTGTATLSSTGITGSGGSVLAGGNLSITHVTANSTFGTLRGDYVSINLSSGSITGVGTISSKTGVDIQTAIGSSTNLTDVYAGGNMNATSIGNITSIGNLYFGSDQVDVNVTSPYTFTMPNTTDKITNIYLGGNGYDVTGATVTLVLTSTQIKGNIYLGGNRGDTTDSVYVCDTGDNVNNIFGGGTDTGTAAKSDISLSGGTVRGNIYGGNENGAGGSGDVTITANSSVAPHYNDIYGGSKDGSGGVTKAVITFPAASTATVKNVYGGNEGGTGTVSTAEITLNGAASAAITGSVWGGGKTGSVVDTTIDIDKDIISGSGEYYGGGDGGGVTGTVNGATVNINAAVTRDVYGGGTGGNTAKSTVNIAAGAVNVFGGGKSVSSAKAGTTTASNVNHSAGAVTGSIYGGGNKANSSDSTPTTGSAIVTNSGGSVGADILGGGLNGATVTSDTQVNFAGGTLTDNIYGGGEASDVNGTATVNITGNLGSSNTVFGGGKTSGTTAKTDVFIKASAQKNVYGGGDAGTTTKDAKITVDTTTGIVDLNVYGGGFKDTSHRTTVDITSTGKVKGDVFGGGDGGIVNGVTTSGYGFPAGMGGSRGANDIVAVYVAGAVGGNIYGGGDSTNGAATVSMTSNVAIANVYFIGIEDFPAVAFNGQVYGGGYGATASAAVDNTKVVIAKAIATTNTTPVGSVTKGSTTEVGAVFGGGRGSNATVVKTTNVMVNSGVTVTSSIADGTVFGGGYGADVGTANTDTATVTIDGTIGNATIENHIYGGSYNGISKTTQVIIGSASGSSAVINGNVYGAGRGTGSTFETYVTVNGGTVAPIGGASAAAPNHNSGNIYGGSSDMNVLDDTNVEIKQGATVQYVFGGGQKGSVAVNTNVEVNGGTVNKEVYGGSSGLGTAGTEGTVNKTIVKISGGTLNDHVYGGGYAAALSANTWNNVKDTSTVTITGGSLGSGINVYGGGNGNPVTNTANVNIQGGSFSNGNVYGGGSDNYDTAATTTGTPTRNTVVTVSKTTGSAEPTDVYGGGENSPVTAATSVEIDGTANQVVIRNNVYGGGHVDAASSTGAIVGPTSAANSVVSAVVVKGTNTTIGTDVYGGGHVEFATGNSNINGYTSVNIEQNATITQHVYGGGFVEGGVLATSEVNGNTTVTVDDATTDNTYGGGNHPGADVTGKTQVTMRSGFSASNVYGGGFETSVGKTTTVDIYDGVVSADVYGGSDGNGIAVTINDGSGTATWVTIHSNQVNGTVYGGGANSNTTRGNVEVKLASPTGSYTGGHVVNGNVYGGGVNQSPVLGDTKVDVEAGAKADQDVFGGGIDNSLVSGNTNVTIAGTVGKDVYGGGTVTSNIGGDAQVTVESGGLVGHDVYGGGWGKGAINGATISDITGKTTVDIKGTVINNVFGGGRDDSDVHGTDGAKVTVYQNAEVRNNVFGGGTSTSMIDEHTEVIISGAVKNNVYGGGWTDSDVMGVKGTTVTVTSTGVVGKADDGNIAVKEGDVYGGGLDNSHIFHGTVVKVLGSGLNGGKVYGNVYGGGSGYGTNNASHINGVSGEGTQVTISGYVGKNVFGGGLTNSEIKGTNGTKVIIEATAKIGHLKTFVNTDYISEYKLTGNVYGGGEGNSDVVNTVDGVGTDVLIKKGAEVYGSVFGGGLDQSDIDVGGGTSATRVTVYGHVDNALGGGRDSNVHQTALGSIVVVAGDGAIVQHDVYGGGWSSASGISALSLRSNINVVSGANVRERIFGGGRGANGSAGDAAMSDTAKIYVGPTDKNGASGLGEGVLNSGGKMTVIGYRGVIEGETTSSFVTGINGNKPSASVPADFADFYLRDSKGFAEIGSIYGGGNQSYVAKDVDIVIDNTKQMAFNRISGGSVSVADYTSLIVGQNRNIVINNFGSGDMTDTTFTQYTPLDKFVVIRFLQDFTNLEANNSFLTVYYNLDAFDNVSEMLRAKHSNGNASHVFGTDYVHDQGSKLTMNSGMYNPWRPEEHTDVNVDSEIHVVNGAKFRVRGGYAIYLKKGIFMHDNLPMNRISLMIDLLLDEGTHSTIATTTQIHSIPDNVMTDNIFRYDELPKTLFPRNIKDDLSADILGVNFYIPPTEIRDTDGNTTDNGGTNNPDKGAGSSNGGTNSSGGGSSSGGGGGGGGAAGGGGLSSGATTSTASSQYTTSPTTAVKTEDAVKAVNAAIKAAGAGKTGSVVEKKAGQISGDTLRAMSTAATKAGGSVMYYADTVRADNSIEGRMYINPSKAAGVQGVIQTGVYTSASKVSAVTKMFNKYFSNKIVVIHLDQAGSFGMEVEIAAKVDLKDLNTKSLQFYSYSLTSNSYVAIQNPKYFIDSSGYLHFNTTVGGEIIVTDQPLQRR